MSSSGAARAPARRTCRCARPLAVPRERHRVHAAHEARRHPLAARRRRRSPGCRASSSSNRMRASMPRQRGAEAQVLAEAEREVRRVRRRAGCRRRPRSARTRLVAVARRVEHHEVVELLDLDPADHGVGGHGAGERLDRRDPAQALLDRGRDERRIGDQVGALVGVLGQRERPARDQACASSRCRRRAGSAGRSAARRGRASGRRPPRRRAATRRRRRDSPASPRCAPSRYTKSSPVALGGLLGRLVGRLDRRVGPTPEVGPVAVGDAEQLRDHHQRERRGDQVDEVEHAASRACGRAPSRASSRMRGSRLRDRARRELAVHELAEADVVGRIHVQDRRRLRRAVPTCASGRSRARPSTSRSAPGSRLISRMSS